MTREAILKLITTISERYREDKDVQALSEAIQQSSLNIQGEANSNARLTNAEARLIRELWESSNYRSHRELADEFGVSIRTIGGVLNYKVYKNA